MIRDEQTNKTKQTFVTIRKHNLFLDTIPSKLICKMKRKRLYEKGLEKYNCFPFILQSNWGARLDFLATYAAVNLDGAMIAKEITSLMGIPVGLSSDLFGNESQIKTGTSGKTVPIGDLYFDISKLKIHLQNVGKVAKEGAKKLKKYVNKIVTKVGRSS